MVKWLDTYSNFLISFQPLKILSLKIPERNRNDLHNIGIKLNLTKLFERNNLYFINNKFKINENNFSEENININKDNNMLNSKLSQLENETITCQAEIKNLTKKLFQYKIQKDVKGLKIKSYIEIEKMHDLLKEKNK